MRLTMFRQAQDGLTAGELRLLNAPDCLCLGKPTLGIQILQCCFKLGTWRENVDANMIPEIISSLNNRPENEE